MTQPAEQLAALKCTKNHVTIWPADLEPFPGICPCWVSDQSTACGRPVHDTGTRLVRVK